MTGDDGLGRVFGSVAGEYDRWRPSYPPEAVEWVATRVDGRSAAEIGAGTGKATVSFLAAGFDVVAVEPDPAMADVGRQRAPAARWVVAAAEEWEGEGRPFDLVYGAQAWHWLPESLDARLVCFVRPGGALALIWNRPDHERRQTHFDDLYRRYLPDPDMSRRRMLHRRDDAHWTGRLEAAGTTVETFEQPWSVDMSTEEYVGLIGTFSDHLTLASEPRRALEAGIAARIDDMGGTLRVDYVTRVYLGWVGHR